MCVFRVARDTTIVNHSRNGSYGESSLEAHIWQEEEEVAVIHCSRAPAPSPQLSPQDWGGDEAR